MGGRVSQSRSDRRRRERHERREVCRMALQSTAEIYRGLELAEAEIAHGMTADALSTIRAVKGLVLIADKTMVEAMRAEDA